MTHKETTITKYQETMLIHFNDYLTEYNSIVAKFFLQDDSEAFIKIIIVLCEGDDPVPCSKPH